jgi:hypothetical protein
VNAARSRAPTEPKAPHKVSRPHDVTERQADKAADVVTRGGSVTGWSFGSAPSAAPGTHLHRQDDGKPKAEDEKYKEAATQTAKAALETPAGKKVKDAVLNDPLVKAVTDAAKTPAGIGAGVGLAATGLTALAATGKPLPFQPPAIPLDKITPGLSAQVTYEGPVNAPTKVGLTLSYSGQGPKSKKGPSHSDKFRAETAKLRAEQEKFKSGMRFTAGGKEDLAQKADEKASQEAVARYVARTSSLPGFGRPLIPLTGGAVEVVAPKPDAEKNPVGEQQKDEDAPLQREPESTATAVADDAACDTGRVDSALRGHGRAVEPSVRRSMEARFGYDFSQVRIHDDAAANSAAHDVRASAFTVGGDIAFAPGCYDPSTPAGRHLLAHELAHVVQQSGRSGPVLHRRSFFGPIGILLSLEEGNRSAEELPQSEGPGRISIRQPGWRAEDRRHPHRADDRRGQAARVQGPVRHDGEENAATGDRDDVIGTNERGLAAGRPQRETAARGKQVWREGSAREPRGGSSLFPTASASLKSLRPTTFDCLDKNLPK